MKRRLLLWISLLLNVFLLLCFWMAIQRLGGWNYTLFRLQQDETGLYHSRKQLFERMPTQQGAVIFLGDSQTEQCEWQEFLHLDSVLVLNRGIVGDHVDGVLARLDEITRHKPSKIFLLVGINDLIFGKKTEAIAITYRNIVASIRNATPDSELFLQSVLPVNNTLKKTGVENSGIAQLNTEIAQIAKAYALPYLDIYAELTDASGNLSPQFTEDGIHLNASGYLAWKNKILHEEH
jgi:lysophospholipase L1-like esterase